MGKARIGKSEQERRELEQMRAAIERYSGPVTVCQPGAGGAHEAKPDHESVAREQQRNQRQISQ